MKIIFTVLGFSLILAACNSSKKLAKDMTMQGITGFVKERTGNQMPSPDIPAQEGKPLSTTIYVFENTHISQVRRNGDSAFYDSVMTKFIKSVDSDKEGRFVIDLPPGKYSVFTKVNGKYYANQFDANNNINPVVVEENKLTEVNITVSASASF